MHDPEIRASHALFAAAWSAYAEASERGEIVLHDGLTIANSNVPWSLLNAAVITEPVASPDDLAQRARTAAAHFADTGLSYLFVGGRSWMGEDATETLAPLGLGLGLTAVGMVADELPPPARPLPEVEIRPVTDEEGRHALADVNAHAYDVPVAQARQAVAGASLWDTPLYGAVASVDGAPASVAFCLPVEDTLYVGFVATLAEHRGRGLAEAVMRRCLADGAAATGITRTALHATPDGYPVYLRMGYRPVDDFLVFGPA